MSGVEVGSVVSVRNVPEGGQPLGRVLGVGPVNVRVELFYNGAERFVPHADVTARIR